ncbi:MAG: hypothetical protein ACXWRE_04095 [Pseudobdellovibrionaceae bacterium]
MKKQALMSLLSIAVLTNGTAAQAAPADAPPAVNKAICNEGKWLCITPMLYTKANLQPGDKNLTDATASNIGARFSTPKSSFFVEMHGSILPYLKYEGVRKDAEETIAESGALATNAVNANLAAGTQQYVAGLLKQAGLRPGTPIYQSMFNQYYATAYKQIAATKGKPYYDAIAANESAAVNEVNRRLPKIRQQDTLQQFVIGYDDGALFFEVGKVKVGARGADTNKASEMGALVADRPVTDELQTLGQARFNATIGKRKIQLGNDTLTVTGFAGKEGRVFLSAVQDTSNALLMSKEDFDKDAKLFGVNAGGASLKLDLGDTGNAFVLTGIQGPKGPTVGTEVSIAVTPVLKAHLAYIYANKMGAQGHQARAQLDIHLGQVLGADIVLAPYAEHSNVQRYDEVPVGVSSGTGLVKQDKFGAALSATKEDTLGFKGVKSSAIVDVGYQTDGTLDDGHNSITKAPVSEVNTGGFVGKMGFSLDY